MPMAPGSDKSREKRRLREAAHECQALLKSTEELLERAKHVGGPQRRERRPS